MDPPDAGLWSSTPNNFFTDGRMSAEVIRILTACDGSLMEDVTLRDVHLRMPRLEDSAALARTTKGNQNNNDSPIGRATNAALVAENIQRLNVHNYSAALPAAGDGVPATHGAYLRRCRGVIDCPYLAGNAPEAEALVQEDCDLHVRALGTGGRPVA